MTIISALYIHLGNICYFFSTERIYEPIYDRIFTFRLLVITGYNSAYHGNYYGDKDKNVLPLHSFTRVI